jgi:hypothetical protein
MLGRHEIKELNRLLKLGGNTDIAIRRAARRMLRAMIAALPQDREVHLRVFLPEDGPARLRIQVDTPHEGAVAVVRREGLAYDGPCVVGATFEADDTGTTWVEFPLADSAPGEGEPQDEPPAPSGPGRPDHSDTPASPSAGG